MRAVTPAPFLPVPAQPWPFWCPPPLPRSQRYRAPQDRLEPSPGRKRHRHFVLSCFWGLWGMYSVAPDTPGLACPCAWGTWSGGSIWERTGSLDLSFSNTGQGHSGLCDHGQTHGSQGLLANLLRTGPACECWDKAPAVGTAQRWPAGPSVVSAHLFHCANHLCTLSYKFHVRLPWCLPPTFPGT